MSVLEDCPDEILLSIVSRLHRCEQLANLALACRRLRGLVLPRLEDSKSFRRLDFGCIEYPRLPSDPFRTILNRPEVCCYVLEVELLFFEAEGDLSYYLEADDLLSEAEDGELIEKIVGDLGVCEWRDGEYLIEALKNGSQSARVALLLLAHPNLEKLSIDFGGDDFWVQWFVWDFTSSSPVRPPRSCQAFHALREVAYAHWNSEENGFDVQCLAPFFMLPSIRKISGHMAITHNDEGFEWEEQFYVSSVTELSFTHSCINLPAFENMLRIPKALNHFYYDFGGLNVGSARFHYDRLLAVVKEAQSGLDEASIEIVDESEFDASDGEFDEDEDDLQESGSEFDA